MRLTFWRALVLIFALPVMLDLGTGCDLVFPLEGPQVPELPDENAHTCRCTCFAGTGDEVGREFNVCLPPALNPNLDGGVLADNAALQDDCTTRVRPTWLEILTTCGSQRIQRKIELEGDAACVCDTFLDRRFVDTCNEDCAGVPLATDCSNQDTATQIPGQEALCLAEPGASARVAIGSPLFDQRSICTVTGDVIATRGGESHTRSATGVVEIAGGPCTSCDVGMVYRLDSVNSFKFSGYAGLASVEFKNIQASGGTVSLATLDGAGNGSFGPLATLTSGRGTRREEELGGLFSDTTTRSYVGSNSEFVGIGVDFAGHACEVAGALLGGSVDDEDSEFAVSLGGPIVNEPPTANAGPDQNVECTGSGNTSATLSAAGSTDPEGNIVYREWRNGGPGGPEIIDPDNDGVITVSQAFGTSAVYALNVVDAFSSISQDSTQVSVVDTTAPTITAASVSPTSLSPPNHKMKPVVVTASATDVCGTATCSIASIASNEPLNGAGDGNTDVDWEITGPLTANLRAERAGKGTGRIYTITVRCGDPTGNGATTTVQVTVPK